MVTTQEVVATSLWGQVTVLAKVLARDAVPALIPAVMGGVPDLRQGLCQGKNPAGVDGLWA